MRLENTPEGRDVRKLELRPKKKEDDGIVSKTMK
jgi:hypothetical protein